jgi:hypothetical protein
VRKGMEKEPVVSINNSNLPIKQLFKDLLLPLRNYLTKTHVE